MADPALALVPGVPETALPDDVLERLPASTPPPPWHLPARALVWWQVGTTPGDSDRMLPVTLAALVDYADSPVGPYREIFAGVLLRRVGRPAVHVPFIAVDSLPSLQAGRAHWSLPKVLASFRGDLPDRTRVDGDGWSVEAAGRPFGPWLPAAVPLLSAQGGRLAPLTVRGAVRAARVEVAASGPTLDGWLGRGRHGGFVARGRIVIGPAALTGPADGRLARQPRQSSPTGWVTGPVGDPGPESPRGPEA